MWLGSGVQRCRRASAGRIRRDARQWRRGRRETDTVPGESVEGRAQMVPAVPAEGERVEVALDVLLAKAVEVAGSQIRPVDRFVRQRPPPTA